MILNLNKTKALVVTRSRTANPPLGDLVLFGVYIHASPNPDSKLPFEEHLRGIVSRVSLRIDIFKVGAPCFCGHLCVTTSLFSICSPNP